MDKALPGWSGCREADKRVVGALEDAGVAQQDEADDGVTKPVCLTLVPDYKVLTLAQREAAKVIGDWAAKRTASDLSDFSHQNVGWKLAWDQGLGAKRPAQKIDLRIALQQLLEADDWLESEPGADLADVFNTADDQKGTDW